MYDHYSRLRETCMIEIEKVFPWLHGKGGLLGSRGNKMVFKSKKAQSFVEFALILPILLLILLGVVELTLFMGSYINLVDLTREAARFASNRDPFALASAGDRDCSTPNSFNFYYDTACIFSPLQDSGSCPNAAFCNGFNSTLPIKSAEDDILISVFTETGVNQGGTIVPSITDNGATNPWVWSNQDTDTSHDNNWRRDCNRLPNDSPGPAEPVFTAAAMQSYLNNTAMPNKGFVVVEVIYCYHQVLNIPIISQFLPNPMKIHTYTVMPLPAAQPTPTPKTP